MNLNVGGGFCMVSYPINLPVGKVIDNIEIAYDHPTGPPDASITAYLGQNRVKPKLGPIAVGGASAQPSGLGQGFLKIQPLNVPIATGSVYWVQLFTQDIGEVNYVAVTYH